MKIKKAGRLMNKLNASTIKRALKSTRSPFAGGGVFGRVKLRNASAIAAIPAIVNCPADASLSGSKLTARLPAIHPMVKISFMENF